MERRIKERYSDAVLRAAMERYDIAASQIHLLDGFESFMYSFDRGGNAYILRIGHSLRRSPDLIRGEVDFINALAGGGAGVARAVPSPRGNLVELIEDGAGEHFLATAFVRALGRPPQSADWTPEFVQTYGQTIGRMHAVSSTYTPSNLAWQRPHWDDPIVLEIEVLLPPSESIVIERHRELQQHLATLPRDRDYCLIHQDAHGGNFFVDDNGRFTFFDFDDCCYGWTAYDIAMVLFYAASGQPDPDAFAAQFMPDFLRGYTREYPFDPAWLAELPHFLKLREIDLYAVIHRSFDLDNISDPWAARFMRGRKERIEQGAPYLIVDPLALLP
ncbi:MAG: phosphotransferase [Anaerolineae bacterium]|nr:phosphotransferase [Anaerolineae bacterium]